MRVWWCHKEKPRLARSKQHDRIHRSPAEPHQFLDMPVRKHRHHRDADAARSFRFDGRPPSRNPPCHIVLLFFRVPSALGMALAPPSTVQDDSPSSVWMRCRRFEPEDGRLRFRNHAPQEVIMFNELRRQVALHGVLGWALVTRVPTGSQAQARRHLIPERDRGPPRPERQEPSKSHVFGSKRVW